MNAPQLDQGVRSHSISVNQVPLVQNTRLRERKAQIKFESNEPRGAEPPEDEPDEDFDGAEKDLTSITDVGEAKNLTHQSGGPGWLTLVGSCLKHYCAHDMKAPTHNWDSFSDKDNKVTNLITDPDLSCEEKLNKKRSLTRAVKERQEEIQTRTPGLLSA